jgi:hypothetical protein
MHHNPQPSFYTLLYIKDSDHDTVVSENGDANIKRYINCCNTLSHSFSKRGYSLTVLTNRPDEIVKYNYAIKVEKIEFNLSVPDDIRFYSAHFKIDAFKYLSTRVDEYSILLDNDIICINDIPENFENIIFDGIPVYYDITDQVYPAYGRTRIIRDKSLIMGLESIGNWAGGEFIGGNQFFWDELYTLCMIFWENYQKHYRSLHHQGDEMLVSCAIEQFIRTKNCMVNIGTIGGISRFWSVKTLHIGKPVEALFDNFLLHLPADKIFLSNYRYADTDKFINDYKKYLKNKSEKLTKRMILKIKKMIKRMLRWKNTV